MMKPVIFTALGVLGTLPVLAAAHMLLTSHFSPRWLSDLNQTGTRHEDRRGKKLAVLSYLVACGIGFAVMAFAGVYASLGWLTSASGVVVDYGDFTEIRQAVAFGAALWMGFQIPALLIDLAEFRATQR